MTTNLICCKLSMGATKQGRNALAVGHVITADLDFGSVVYAHDDRGRVDIEAIIHIEVPSDRTDEARDYLDGCDDVRIYEVRS